MDDLKHCGGCSRDRGRGDFHRDRSRPDGLQRRCKDCQSSPERRAGKLAAEAVRRERFPERIAESRRRQTLAKYGIGRVHFEALLIAQAGRCGGCGEPLTAPNIDHDHATGAVRGLLCSPCNLALGCAKDDPARLRGLLAYLG